MSNKPGQDPSHTIKDAGLSVTRGRISVLSVLSDAPAPLDALEIRKRSAANGVKLDKVTVYRILDQFIAAQLVRRIDFHEGKFRYELDSHHHHHIMCTSCGTVVAVDTCEIGDIESSLGKKYGFSITSHSLEFFGVCSSCA